MNGLRSGQGGSQVNGSGFQEGRDVEVVLVRGCKPKPPKIPSRQIEPRYDRIQVDGLPVAAEGVVAIHVDVAPSADETLL